MYGMYTLSVCNKELYEFYTENKLDFTQINILFYQMLQQINHSSNQPNQLIAHMKDQLETSFYKTSHHLDTHFTQIQKNIVAETSKLLTTSSVDKQLLDDFKQSVTTAHSQLFAVIQANELRLENKLERTETKVVELNKILMENVGSYSALQQSVNEMLKKFERGGNGKGNVSEQVLYHILLSLYPSAQIDYVGEMKEMGDIMLEKTGKPKILIENKDHSSCNVPKTDVEKFIRDCEIQNCCGIMFAQNKGIANKKNFELQLNNGNVILYVHEVNFDVDKIRVSIELVEQFKLKLDEIGSTHSSYSIDNQTLNEINKEFTTFVSQKQTLLKLVKDFNDKMSATICEFKMPSLEKYLGANFAHATNQQGDTVCAYCKRFIPKSLSQHYRYCSAKKEFDNKIDRNCLTNV